MARMFELPILYRNKGVPPRHRTASTYVVVAKALFSIPEADASALEPALTMRLTYKLKGETEDRVNDNVLMQYDGHLVRPVDSSRRRWTEEDMTVGTLESLGKGGFRDLPKQLWVPSLATAYEYGRENYEEKQIKAKHISHSGRQEAIDELQARIDATMVIVGDKIYAHAPDPRINVSYNDEGVRLDRSLIASRDFSFPPDCPELVTEFTDWLESEFGLPIRTDDDSFSRGIEFIIQSDDIPYSGNPVIEAALRLADRAELNITNVDYYGADTKTLGLLFRAEPTVENAMAFVDAFEDAALGGEYPDSRMSGDTRTFAVFRKFVDIMPPAYKGDYSGDISVPMTWTPVMGS